MFGRKRLKELEESIALLAEREAKARLEASRLKERVYALESAVAEAYKGAKPKGPATADVIARAGKTHCDTVTLAERRRGERNAWTAQNVSSANQLYGQNWARMKAAQTRRGIELE